MKIIEIEVRGNGISIQADNIKANKEEAKEVLKNALEALDKEPDFEAKNEIIVKFA